MSTYVKIGNAKYPATVDGILQNRLWDNRESKAITLTATYAEAAAIFADGIAWSVVQECEAPVINESTGEPTGEAKTITNEYDNAAFSVLGDIVVHADGTCTINKGKPTDLEDLLEKLYGGKA